MFIQQVFSEVKQKQGDCRKILKAHPYDLILNKKEEASLEGRGHKIKLKKD